MSKTPYIYITIKNNYFSIKYVDNIRVLNIFTLDIPRLNSILINNI